MKNILKLLLALFPTLVIGQTQTQNYLKTVTYKVPSLTKIAAPTITQAVQSITYFDELGRPVQQILTQQSATGKDIITAIDYDGYDRQTKEYLPFASTQNNGAFINPSSLITDLTNQYKANYGITNTNPYSEKELEAAPLNRVLRQAAPGNDWKLNSGHEIKFITQTNSPSEVKFLKAFTKWDAAAGLYTISFLNNGLYAANQLYKTVTYNENSEPTPYESQGSTVEYKNKEGQIILKRTYNKYDNHDTYYVYDIYGNLTYVIPPKATDLISSTTTLTDLTSTAVVNSTPLHLTAANSIRLLPGFHAQSGSTFSALIDNPNQSVLDNLCYQYKYDYRNRLVEKKLPGKQWEFIVYDKLDRPVATGPALSPFTDDIVAPANVADIGWLFTKYDNFNRAIITGWLAASEITSAARKTLQDMQNAATSNFSETKIATTSNTVVPPTIGVVFRYTNITWPTSGYHILTVNYFDDYNYPNAPIIPASVEGQSVYYNTTIKPVGLPTGSWIRILEASTDYRNESDYSLYDEKARAIRVYATSFLGGYTFTDSKLDLFSGQLQYSITKHKRLAASTEIITKDAFTYTAQDRLETQTHQINDGAIEVIAVNTYNELGQLYFKKVGNTVAVPTQKIDYTYNIRGWLTDINDINMLAKGGTDPKDLFAFKINYNEISDVSKKLYNGNISQTLWVTDNTDKTIKNYIYAYDRLNRLISATDNTSLFNEDNIAYDKNGNILNLKRKGPIVANPSIATPDNYGVMDDLTYSYDAGNRLMKVADTATLDSFGFKDDALNIAADTADDYTYDANGNMITDANKNITDIKYNHFNLPSKITFAGTGNITYLYNAIGEILQKNVSETSPSAITTTEYLSGFHYKRINSGSTDIQFFPTAEGYVEPSGSSYKYIYQYKDHLGNVRINYDKALVIQEENNYYPFGLKHKGYNGNTLSTNTALKFKFQGQERQDELSLNWDSFKWRNYDYAIGRFMCIDPLAEKYTYNSPYAFAENRVIDGRELEGLEWVDAKGNTIYNTNKANGAIGYTSYATSENKNLGNALRSTTTGSEQFNKLVNMNHPVEINVNTTENKTRTNEDGSKSVVYGVAVTPTENNPDNKTTITLYDKNITGATNAAAKADANGKQISWPTGDGTGEIILNGLTKIGLTGAVLGEEVEHATPENINLKRSGATTSEVEKKPNTISDKILTESLKQK